jgi:hypothetical protein
MGACSIPKPNFPASFVLFCRMASLSPQHGLVSESSQNPYEFVPFWPKILEYTSAKE